jgi:hypothetical protein
LLIAVVGQLATRLQQLRFQQELETLYNKGKSTETHFKDKKKKVPRYGYPRLPSNQWWVWTLNPNCHVSLFVNYVFS